MNQQARRAHVAAMLAPSVNAFRRDVLDLVEPWQRQYGEVLMRYKFLVLRGASRTGKSTLARSLGGTPFVQTVQSAVAPDLRGYEPAKHSYIVFDNVNDMAFVLNHRALFQANNDVHTLGEPKAWLSSKALGALGLVFLSGAPTNAKPSIPTRAVAAN